MTSFRNSRNVWIIIGLAIVLAGMSAYYFLQREKINRQLLLAAAPVYYFEDDMNLPILEGWGYSYRGEFEDSLSYQQVIQLRTAYGEVQNFFNKLYSTHAEQQLNDLFTNKITAIEYYSRRLSLTTEEQTLFGSRIEDYNKAFQELCKRPVIRYWNTPYRTLRTGSGSTAVFGVEPVIHNLQLVKQFIPVNGKLILRDATYSLDNLSPDDLTCIIDSWFHVNKTVIDSYDNVLIEAGYIISLNYNLSTLR